MKPNVNRFGPQERMLHGSVPDKVKCWCGGDLSRRIRADLTGEHDIICWPHHLCGKCGSIVRFSQDGYNMYQTTLQKLEEAIAE
jgi:hypothetical protein